MAIEFTCTACQKLVRTPDSTAGKKGRCPFCQAVVQIPAVSEPAAVAPAPQPRPPSQKSLPTTAASSNSAIHSATTVSPKLPAGNRAAAAEVPLTFSCSECGKPNRAPAALAGRKGRCSACKAVVVIPAAAQQPTSTASKPATPAAPVRTQPVASAGLQPMPSAGLSPLGAGLSPLGPTTDLFAGLQPLGSPNDPFGAGPQPLGQSSDPFGGPALQPLGGASKLAPNPYSSPSPSSYRGSYSSGPEIDDPRQRRGLPWQRDQDLETFTATVKTVLFSFPNAFREMWVGRGLGSALGFMVSAFIVVLVVNALVSFALNLTFLFAFGSNALSENPELLGRVVGGLLLGLVIQIVAGVVMGSITSIIGSFISSAINHVCLLIVGGANRGFETTYNVTCYATGACFVLLIVPVVGILAFMVLLPLVLIFGFMHAHCTSGVKATIAVLIPYLACTAVVAIGIFMLFAAITAAFPGQS